MTAKKTEHKLTDSQKEEVLEKMSHAFVALPRSPLFHKPSESKLTYENVTFLSEDGTPLEGWFIPKENSNKVIIANHPMGFTRSGLPTHLDPWCSIWKPSGNDVEVNFIPDYKILHDAGYNILAYDLRNHGQSSAANGGIISSGIFESRDVIGSINYVRNRHDTQHMGIAMFSRCLGCNSTLYAMYRNPEVFNKVKALVGPQPVSEESILSKQLNLAGISPEQFIAKLDKKIILKTGLSIAERDPWKWAKGVKTPTFLYQVHDDILTDPSDVQTMFDNIPTDDKKLHWIKNSTRRWDGYLEFQKNPEPMLEWFEDHFKK